MDQESSKVTIHMVSSLDGFIAKKDGSVDWMESKDVYNKGKTLAEEYIQDFLDKIDCYVMGSKTYEQALELGWPYGDVPVKVMTNRKLQTNRKTVEFLGGDLSTIVNENIKPTFKQIWMVGGAALTKDFIRFGLADEIVISIIPIILGDGTLFFNYIGKQQTLHLKDMTAYKDGMVELTYEIVKP